jgi:hypothetical protein
LDIGQGKEEVGREVLDRINKINRIFAEVSHRGQQRAEEGRKN